MNACQRGARALDEARRHVERLSARTAARLGRPMSLDDLRQAFWGWTYTDPYGSDEYMEIVQQHVNQQRSKQLQELGAEDHFPFGSWV